MTHTLLLITAILIGYGYSVKDGNRAMKEIDEYNQSRSSKPVTSEQIKDNKNF